MPKVNLKWLKLLGFDKSYRIRGTGANAASYAVRCSQCEAAVINQTPCHERGCLNELREDRHAD
jgi:hypothetical protein